MSDGRMQRNLEIDTLRGFACVLLVSFHVVGVSADMGLRLPADHWLQQINGALAYLRMPLFSFLSGYVYAFRPYKPKQSNARGFIQGKMRRLLLPMLTVGTIFALMQNAMPGANQRVTNWGLLHIVPVAHFWFLEALFIIFLIVVALEHWRLLSTPPRFAGVWAITVMAFVFLQVTPYFAANGAVYLMPFFLAGLACKRFDLHTVPARRLAAAVLALAGLWLAALPQPLGQGLSLPGLLAGLSAAFLLLRSGWRWRALAYVGSFSFAIYLMHVFFTAGSRMALTRLGVGNLYVLLGLGTLLGIAGPMLAALLIGRSARLKFWLLGEAPR
jgi:fucose 4-O-acetylase-like acetyltransferase